MRQSDSTKALTPNLLGITFCFFREAALGTPSILAACAAAATPAHGCGPSSAFSSGASALGLLCFGLSCFSAMTTEPRLGAGFNVGAVVTTVLALLTTLFLLCTLPWFELVRRADMLPDTLPSRGERGDGGECGLREAWSAAAVSAPASRGDEAGS